MYRLLCPHLQFTCPPSALHLCTPNAQHHLQYIWPLKRRRLITSHFWNTITIQYPLRQPEITPSSPSPLQNQLLLADRSNNRDRLTQVTPRKVSHMLPFTHSPSPTFSLSHGNRSPRGTPRWRDYKANDAYVTGPLDFTDTLPGPMPSTHNVCSTLLT